MTKKSFQIEQLIEALRSVFPAKETDPLLEYRETTNQSVKQHEIRRIANTISRLK